MVRVDYKSEIFRHLLLRLSNNIIQNNRHMTSKSFSKNDFEEHSPEKYGMIENRNRGERDEQK